MRTIVRPRSEFTSTQKQTGGKTWCWCPIEEVLCNGGLLYTENMTPFEDVEGFGVLLSALVATGCYSWSWCEVGSRRELNFVAYDSTTIPDQLWIRPTWLCRSEWLAQPGASWHVRNGCISPSAGSPRDWWVIMKWLHPGDYPKQYIDPNK